MSSSFIDRFLVEWSVNRDGATTRSLGSSFSDRRELSASGLISDNPDRWAVELYLPVEPSRLRDYLIRRNELSDSQQHAFAEAFAQVESILNQNSAAYHTEFSKWYSALDPDSDHRDPPSEETDAAKSPDALPDRHCPSPSILPTIELCERMLVEAGYSRLQQSDIEACVGVASQWGVPLHVDFSLFDQLVVYSRGDIVGTRFRRRLRTLYQREPVEVPLYQRMVVLFKLHDDDVSEERLSSKGLHLRMFKNIPKLDVDMLLPGAKVRISKVDHAKIIVPSLGGLLMSLRKLGHFVVLFAAITLYSSMMLAGLIFASIGYIIRSIVSYFQTKNRYLLNLAKNLYYQKLDTNAGVGYRLIQQARQQSEAEATLALYGILSSDTPLSERKLRRHCERMMREAVNVEVDFQVERSLKILSQAGLVEQVDGENWGMKTRGC
ncbi:hypothetical protein Pla52o_21840 [Novipirellula galeiformis]|uniref:DUF3754 domain-containing protein n=1 Tax=Novipirellula galeiformis TaxID=2528004 RepID=A0A5C6CIJ0_9BACT|nr:DUF3754 domain-containing protein [Novipirellula galeiformis]TWU24258.1 hypothetical protein Pla52o_21840 [Novipirellula galeiformis]